MNSNNSYQLSMESLAQNGHYYIMIVQGVSQGSGQVYYDVNTKELIEIENKENMDNAFIANVTNLIDYIISRKKTPYTYEELLHTLLDIKFLCHKNLDSDDNAEMLFGFPKGTLCYEDECDNFPNETVSEHITHMENEYLQCDNADVFIISKKLWPTQTNVYK